MSGAPSPVVASSGVVSDLNSLGGKSAGSLLRINAAASPT